MSTLPVYPLNKEGQEGCWKVQGQPSRLHTASLRWGQGRSGGAGGTHEAGAHCCGASCAWTGPELCCAVMHCAGGCWPTARRHAYPCMRVRHLPRGQASFLPRMQVCPGH